MQSLIFVCLMLINFCSQAQILEPSKWNHSLSKDKVAVGDEIELIFQVSLDKTWYIYSSGFKPAEFGPLPTQFEFEPHASYQLIGDIVPVGVKEKKDELLGLTLQYMDEDPVFRQKVRVLSENPVIKGTYEYQVCTLVDGKCIPGDGAFEFNIKTIRK